MLMQLDRTSHQLLSDKITRSPIQVEKGAAVPIHGALSSFVVITYYDLETSHLHLITKGNEDDFFQ